MHLTNSLPKEGLTLHQRKVSQLLEFEPVPVTLNDLRHFSDFFPWRGLETIGGLPLYLNHPEKNNVGLENQSCQMSNDESLGHQASNYLKILF